MTFGTHKLHKSTNKNGVLLTLELYVNSYSLEGPTESWVYFLWSGTVAMSVSSIIFARRQQASWSCTSMGEKWDPHFWAGRSYRVTVRVHTVTLIFLPLKLENKQWKRYRPVSDRGFLWTLHCDHCAVSNHSAAICHRMYPALKSTESGWLWSKIWAGRGWSINVSQIRTQSGRDMELSYTKEIFCRLSTMHELRIQTDRQTDRQKRQTTER